VLESAFTATVLVPTSILAFARLRKERSIARRVEERREKRERIKGISRTSAHRSCERSIASLHPSRFAILFADNSFCRPSKAWERGGKGKKKGKRKKERLRFLLSSNRGLTLVGTSNPTSAELARRAASSAWRAVLPKNETGGGEEKKKRRLARLHGTARALICARCLKGLADLPLRSEITAKYCGKGRKEEGSTPHAAQQISPPI